LLELYGNIRGPLSIVNAFYEPVSSERLLGVSGLEGDEKLALDGSLVLEGTSNPRSDT
jgi:hypothetical protein